MNVISGNSNSWANYEPRVATKRSYSHRDANEVNVSRNESPEKPIRKRSRVFKKTPTTFLIANPSNFRALVQQSTGCQSSNCFKGPINLKFGASDDDEADIFSPDSTIPMLEFNYKNDKYLVEEQHEEHQQNVIHEGQKQFTDESEESSSSAGDVFCPIYINPSPTTPYSMALDDLVLEDIFLEDFDGDFLSNALADEALFFYSY